MEELLRYLGFVLPAAIDVINRRIKDTDIRFWVSVLLCTVVGGSINYFVTDGVGFTTINSVATDVLMTFGLAQFSYKGFWEKSGVRGEMKLDATRL